MISRIVGKLYWKSMWRVPLMAAVTVSCIMLRWFRVDNTKVMRIWANACIGVCGITFNIKGSPNSAAQLIISNHISYLDIVILYYFWPAAKVLGNHQARKYFLVGKLFSMCGMFFVDRESLSSRSEARQKLGEMWAAGEKVALCPEGTVSYTGVGFRRGSFVEAAKSKVLIQGVKLKYPQYIIDGLDGRWFDERLFWVTNQNMEIEVEFFPAIKAQGDPQKLTNRWQKKLVGH
jgi:1-acyl-sn-glycerol-3-phosphate acyltransferase